MEIKEKRSLVSYDELKEIFSSFKRTFPEFLTNYVPNKSAHNQWIDNQAALLFRFDSAVFIVHNKNFMCEVVFMCTPKESFIPYIRMISKEINMPVVVERVVRENHNHSIGTPDYLLRRMSRVGEFNSPKTIPNRVIKANMEDLPDILKIFKIHFNPLTERIPDASELGSLIQNGGVTIIRRKGGIGGMVIYEKDINNIHLRYWWVDPLCRNLGMGSDLLSVFFTEGQNCKRQFLWVFSDNNNAIEKYEHYGFSFDGIADEIYVIK